VVHAGDDAEDRGDVDEVAHGGRCGGERFSRSLFLCVDKGLHLMARTACDIQNQFGGHIVGE
jgi:hypothetical protein